MSYYLKQQNLFLFIILLLSACSSPQPQNKWQYDAAGMCKNYQEHFLQDKPLRANLDLRHARELASRTADLKTLIDIELTVCAMELSTLNPGQCDKVSHLLTLEPNTEQNAYHRLLISQFSQEDLPDLPSQYKHFAQALLHNDKTKINEALSKIEPLSSQLVASALAEEEIDDKNIDEIIQKLSFNGYKRVLLAWLVVQMQREDNPEEKARLKAKIEVLTSN